MLIHCSIPANATGPAEWPAMPEDQDGHDLSWKEAPAEEGGSALSVQGPTCALSANLLQASKRRTISGRNHKGREI